MKRQPWHDRFLELVLSAQTPRKDTGQKRRETLERKRREKAARSRAIAEAKWNERRDAHMKRNRPGLGNRLVDRIMALMEPGKWYGLEDLAKAAGLTHQQAGRVEQHFKEKGWATSVRSKAWDPEGRPADLAAQGIGVARGSEFEPKRLWQLTEAGEAEKMKVALARGDFRDPLSPASE